MKNNFIYLCLTSFLLTFSMGLAHSKDNETIDPAYLKKVIEESSCTYCDAIDKSRESININLPKNYIRIKVDGKDQLTPEMYEILKDYGFDPAEEGFDILIGIVNDHNAYAMGLIKERGDDFGYTHGAVLEIGKKLNRSYKVKFKYSTDLFSMPIDGEKIELEKGKFSIRQQITNENIARLVLDNYELGKAYYFRGELGWHQLQHDPNNSNFLLASSQQLRFHQLLNTIKPGMNMIPKHEFDGTPDRSGIWTGIFIGAEQMFLSDSAKVRLTFREELGSQYSAATDEFYNQVEGKVALTYQKNPRKLAFEVGAGMKYKTHNGGLERISFIDLGIGRARKWRVGIRAEYYSGELNNDSGHNVINPELGINDPTARIYYQYFTN